MSDKEISTVQKGELVEKSFVHYLPVVIVGVLLCGVPSSIMSSLAGIYYPVIAEDMGVPIQDVSMWRTMSYIASLIFAPIAGSLFTRWNAKWVVLAACVVESLCVASFGIAPNVQMMWVAGFITGLTNTIILGLSVSTLINRWFRVHVGLIIGICTCFTGAGALIFIPIGQYFIETAGWRQSYINLGVFSLIVMTIAILLLLENRPEDKGMLPYGYALAIKAAAEQEEKEEEIPLSVRPRNALKSPVFWIAIILAFILNWVVNINNFFASYVAFYNEQAEVLSGALAATFVTGATLTSFCMGGMTAGKLVMGFASDISVRVALVAMVACAAVGMIFVWQFPDTVLLPIGGILYGFIVPGALVFTPMLIRTVFGEGAAYPMYLGYFSASLSLGGAAATSLWPTIADAFGGWSAVFELGLVLLAVLLVLGLVVYHMKDSLPREALTEEELRSKGKKVA